MHTLRRVPLFLIPFDRKNNENPSNATTKELVKLRHGPCESASEGSLLNLHLGKTQQINPKAQNCKTWMKVCWCTKWNQSFAWISIIKPLFVDYPWIWNKKTECYGHPYQLAMAFRQPSASTNQAAKAFFWKRKGMAWRFPWRYWSNSSKACNFSSPAACNTYQSSAESTAWCVFKTQFRKKTNSGQSEPCSSFFFVLLFFFKTKIWRCFEVAVCFFSHIGPNFLQIKRWKSKEPSYWGELLTIGSQDLTNSLLASLPY